MNGKYTLITGGAGFIGANLANRLVEHGERVLLLDDLSRPLVHRNLEWLEARGGDLVEARISDVRDRAALADAVSGASRIFHFAAQVAVTTSLTRPLEDFEINALGTLRLLEAVRALKCPPPLVFTSTNKVYGALPDIAIRRSGRRYEPAADDVRSAGISEARPLDFHSPYGCSKGAADQYVLDYARSYGLPATVLRMSCIYGPRQFGTEDQGWVAHLLLRAIDGDRITVYGDGFQLRDILFIDDLLDALLATERSISVTAGNAYNIGGGPENTLSLNELFAEMGELVDGPLPEIVHEPWRTGDQRYYVSDFRRFTAVTGFRPRVGVREGLRRLHQWLVDASMSSPRGEAAP